MAVLLLWKSHAFLFHGSGNCVERCHILSQTLCKKQNNHKSRTVRQLLSYEPYRSTDEGIGAL